MLPSISVLVLGVGEFGRHYVDILSRLNSRPSPHVPQIGRLIVTRTRFEAAERLAVSLQKKTSCSINEVIAAKASCLKDVRNLLHKFHPGLTAITAKDKELGDTIHALYAGEAIDYGAVLCEKPFCNANGDGSSLKYFQKIKNGHNRQRFGLELPLAVVAEEMLKTEGLRNLLLNASKFEFNWQARDRGENNIIDDLALHPWSLIPPPYKATQIDALDNGDRADIRIKLKNAHNLASATCRIRLKAGGSYRGMKIDDVAIRFLNIGGLIKLIRMNGGSDTSILDSDKPVEGDILLQVNNPLEQHIVAALRHTPIVGMARAFDSQLFLEQVHGFRSYAISETTR
jgi:hypothetical protein